MPGRTQRPGSLATQISISTLGLVTVAVLIASVLALGGVYNLARQESQARLETLRDILAEDLTARFVVADRVQDSAVTGVLTADDEDAVRETLFRLAGQNTEYFDVVLLADPEGPVVTAWPPAAAPASVAGQSWVDAALESNTKVFVWEPGESTEEGRVWIASRVPEPGTGDPLVLASRLRIGFVGFLVEEISSSEDQRVALVLDSDGDIVEIGTGGLVIASPTLAVVPESDGSSVGEASFEDGTLGEFEGFYADLPATGELGWRVAVLEPQSVALDRTQSALLPASLTVAIAVLVAMVVAFLFGRRLAEPLRVLEARARDVASGAYVDPISVDREDEVGRLADAFNAMAARLNALQDLAQLLASASDLEQVLDGILSAMEHIMGTGHAAVFLLDDEGLELEMVKASGVAANHPGLSVSVSGAGWVSQAFRTGKSLSFMVSAGDSESDPVLDSFLGGIESGLVVPLSIGRQPFGVVLVVSDINRRFSEAETEMARAFSAQAAVAVQNSRLFEEEHLSRTEAEALRDMAELLAGPKGVSETLEQVGVIAASLLDMSSSTLAMSTSDRRAVDIPGSDDPERDGRYLELWDAVTSGDVERGMSEPVTVTYLARDEQYADIAGERGVEAVLMIPMMQGGREKGVLVLESDVPGRTFSPRDVEVAYATGKTVSVALETSMLFHQARRRAENLEMVFRISQAVGLSLQTSVVLNRVLDVVQKMIPGTGVSLMQFDARKGVLSTAMARGIQDKTILLAEVGVGDDIPGEAFASRQTVNVPDIEHLDTPMSRLLQRQSFRSWLCAPLLARGRSIGVLSVYSADVGAFGSEDSDLVSTFAAQAALALDTAELFEKEHAVASVLQKSILPERLPEIPWLETASVYKPAGAEADIGGDYYDLFWAQDGRLVLAIGDVCGKGVQAATKTSAIRYTLRGLVTAGLGPSTALKEINKVVSETGDIADIVTMWVGYLEPKTGRLTYANAGHPPVMVRDAGGKMTYLGPTGPLLGAIDDVKYGKKSITLQYGSTVTLYTDGVTEARSDAGLFGEARLTDVVSQGGSPQAVVDRMLDAVTEYTHDSLRDDVAILVCEYLGPAGRGDVS